MPEYVQVQTYVACDKNTFSEVIPQFWQVLERVHGLSPQVRDWLSHLEWPSWEEGYPVDFPTVLLQSQDQAFFCAPLPVISHVRREVG